MFRKIPHRISLSSRAGRWPWLARALALVGILLPVTSWQTAAQLQSRYCEGGSADDRENEFPGDNEEGDSTDGDFEAQLVFRRSPRESLRPGLVRSTSERLVVTGDSVCFAQAHRSDLAAAACTAAPLHMRC
jgi:hypothetical protein